MKRRFSHGEEEVRDDLPTEVRDERFRRQRRRRPKIRARSPLWVCPVASAALGHKIERRPLSVSNPAIRFIPIRFIEDRYKEGVARGKTGRTGAWHYL